MKCIVCFQIRMKYDNNMKEEMSCKTQKKNMTSLKLLLILFLNNLSGSCMLVK